MNAACSFIILINESNLNFIMTVKHNPTVLPVGSTEIVSWHIGISHPPFKNPGSAPELSLSLKST